MLTYRDRGTSDAQFDIVSNNAVVGNVWKAILTPTSGGSVRWRWTWHAGPGSGPQQHGTAERFDEARAQIEAQWLAWLEAAGLAEK